MKHNGYQLKSGKHPDASKHKWKFDACIVSVDFDSPLWKEQVLSNDYWRAVCFAELVLDRTMRASYGINLHPATCQSCLLGASWLRRRASSPIETPHESEQQLHKCNICSVRMSLIILTRPVPTYCTLLQYYTSIWPNNLLRLVLGPVPYQLLVIRTRQLSPMPGRRSSNPISRPKKEIYWSEVD